MEGGMELPETALLIPGAHVRMFSNGSARYLTVDYRTTANQYLTVIRPDLSYSEWEERGLRFVEAGTISGLTNHLEAYEGREVVSVKELKIARGREIPHYGWQVTRLNFSRIAAGRRSRATRCISVRTTQEILAVAFSLHGVVFLFEAP